MTQKTRNRFSVTASSTFALSALGSERKTGTDFFPLLPHNLSDLIYLFICWRRGRKVHPGAELCLALPGAAPGCTEPQSPRAPLLPHSPGGEGGGGYGTILRSRAAAAEQHLAALGWLIFLQTALKWSLGKVKTLHATPSRPGMGVRATGVLQTRALRDAGLSACARKPRGNGQRGQGRAPCGSPLLRRPRAAPGPPSLPRAPPAPGEGSNPGRDPPFPRGRSRRSTVLPPTTLTASPSAFPGPLRDGRRSGEGGGTAGVFGGGGHGAP